MIQDAMTFPICLFIFLRSQNRDVDCLVYLKRAKQQGAGQSFQTSSVFIEHFKSEAKQWELGSAGRFP